MGKRTSYDSTSDDIALSETNDVPLPGVSSGADVGTTSTVSAPTLAASEADLEAAKQQSQGELPRAAPKAGEGVNPSAREVDHPELEPPPPPSEFRVAPSAPDAVERPDFEGDRPSLDDIEKAGFVEVQTVDRLSAGVYVAGVFVTPQPTRVDVQTVLARTRQHLIQLATDPRIQVRLA